jgi:hypothetical protein
MIPLKVIQFPELVFISQLFFIDLTGVSDYGTASILLQVLSHPDVPVALLLGNIRHMP